MEYYYYIFGCYKQYRFFLYLFILQIQGMKFVLNNRFTWISLHCLLLSLASILKKIYHTAHSAGNAAAGVWSVRPDQIINLTTVMHPSVSPRDQLNRRIDTASSLHSHA